MRSIERRFTNLQQKRPELSSLMNFGTAMRGQNFSTDAIHRWFGKLVNLDDYERRDKRAILKHLVALTRAEGNRNAATNASMESESAVAGT